jgi:DNA helicase-2/ATP-dependent DNA helicase PcrA
MYPKVGKVTFNKIWKCLVTQENPLETFLKDKFMQIVSKQGKPWIEECRKTIQLFFELPASYRVPEKVIDVSLNRGNYSDASLREEDLIQLENFSAQFLQMEDLLNELALITNMAKEEGVEEDENFDKVALSTIHQAKGLEWPYVFLIWCADGMIPLQRALKEEGGEEKERRLFYVEVTRAKDQIYLCFPALDYTRSSGVLTLAPSQIYQRNSAAFRIR